MRRSLRENVARACPPNQLCRFSLVQAYLARDEAQTQIACSLAEKDTLRAQLVDLQEEIFTLRAQKTQREPSQSSVSDSPSPVPTWPCLRPRSFINAVFLQDHSLSWDIHESPPPRRLRLRRMNAVPPGCTSTYEWTKVGFLK